MHSPVDSKRFIDNIGMEIKFHIILSWYGTPLFDIFVCLCSLWINMNQKNSAILRIFLVNNLFLKLRRERKISSKI